MTTDPQTTITIQAASDSIMTHNNTTGGTALTDDDTRKVYGLPHTYLGSGTLKNKDNKRIGFKAGTDEAGRKIFVGNFLVMNDSQSMYTGKLDPTRSTLRWDEVSPNSWEDRVGPDEGPDSIGTAGQIGGYGIADPSITGLLNVEGFTIDRRPTTTAFQLRCQNISHGYNDMSSVSPLFGTDWGTDGNTGSPEQLDMLGFSVGMRTEEIKLTGVLIDRGGVTAANPRRQVLLNIARTQYLKIRNTAPIDSETAGDLGAFQQGVKAEWGGRHAGPFNPRSYPCLTIMGQGYHTSTAGDAASNGIGNKGDVEPDGAYRIYRGLIKSISFSASPGRPDFWQWNMTFQVIANEKRAVGLGIYDAQFIKGQEGEDE